jgi:hypothetical protein
MENKEKIQKLTKAYAVFFTALKFCKDAVDIYTISFYFNQNKFSNKPWKINLLWKMFQYKRRIRKTNKVITRSLTHRVKLRNLLIKLRMESDTDYINRLMQRHVKFQRYEQAAELRDKILFIHKPTV